MRLRICFLLSGAALGMVAAVHLYGETYDVALDFSVASNPNGVWSYGYMTSLGSGLIAYQESGNSSGLDYWVHNLSLGAPSVIHNPTSDTIDRGTPVVAAGQAAFHPGPGGEYSVFRFTAPDSGAYQLDCSFHGIDKAGTTTDVHVLLNGTSIFDGSVNGFGPGTGPSFNANLVLAVGDRVDLAAGFGNGSFFNDSTAVDARLTRSGGLPQLLIRRTQSPEVELAWSTNYTDYLLERTPTMTAPDWTLMTDAVENRGDEFVVIVEIASREAYFRLRRFQPPVGALRQRCFGKAVVPTQIPVRE